MKALAITVAMAAMSAAPVLWGQQPDAPQAKEPAVEVQSPALEDLTGCLAIEENSYTLRTTTGVIQLEGDAVELEGQAGKTVRVTGSYGTADGKAAFEITELEVVSPKCES